MTKHARVLTNCITLPMSLTEMDDHHLEQHITASLVAFYHGQPKGLQVEAVASLICGKYCFVQVGTSCQEHAGERYGWADVYLLAKSFRWACFTCLPQASSNSPGPLGEKVCTPAHQEVPMSRYVPACWRLPVSRYIPARQEIAATVPAHSEVPASWYIPDHHELLADRYLLAWSAWQAGLTCSPRDPGELVSHDWSWHKSNREVVEIEPIHTCSNGGVTCPAIATIWFPGLGYHFFSTYNTWTTNVQQTICHGMFQRFVNLYLQPKGCIRTYALDELELTRVWFPQFQIISH
jgi:hypothetical protein